MGERCLARNGPEELSRYNEDEICHRCKGAGLSLASVPGEKLAAGGEVCRMCGIPGIELLDAWVCEECAAEVRTRQFVWEPYAPKPRDPPVEERFADLFRAARALMEQDAPKDRVFPTLAFAGYGTLGAIDLKNRLIKAWGKPETWETEVGGFVSRFPSAQPVQVIDDVLILEQEPVSIRVIPYPHTEIPKLVEIYVFERRKHTEPEEIARRYEQELSAAGIAHDFAKSLPISTEYFEGRAAITVPNHKPDVPAAYASAVWGNELPRFPHPARVGKYYESEEIARELGMRERTDHPGAAASLVPACVALILREVGGMEGRQPVHRLLNQHVYVGQFEKSKIPEDGSDKSKENTLWEPINRPKLFYKVRRPLYASRDAFIFPE